MAPAAAPGGPSSGKADGPMAVKTSVPERPMKPAPEPTTKAMATAPQPPPEGPLARERFAATQEWLKTAPAKTYAIELLTVRSGRSEVLENFVRQLSQLLDADSIHVYSVKIEDAQYYAVAYGNYGSVADTVTAMGQLPETLKARAPYPRSFGRMRTQNQQ
jgi:septal ring-binding cell division protein DamX